jgi:hypothetical protein
MVGNLAVGVWTVGNLAVGVLTVGNLAVGILTVGNLAVGVLTQRRFSQTSGMNHSVASFIFFSFWLADCLLL